jgi:hypothetical protein
MQFEHKKGKQPEESASFASKNYIGNISESNFPRVQAVVEVISPPAKQINGLQRIDPGKTLRRCHEWANEAVQALKDEGILEE